MTDHDHDTTIYINIHQYTSIYINILHFLDLGFQQTAALRRIDATLFDFGDPGDPGDPEHVPGERMVEEAAEERAVFQPTVGNHCGAGPTSQGDHHLG